MAQPTSRSEFKEFCLRKLGKPVIEINVSEEQVDDRLDESLRKYWDFHFDGTEKVFFKHQVTANNVADGYITMPENIIGTVDLFDIGDALSTNNLFNIRYQFALNEVYDLTNYSLTNYYMAMQHIQFLEEMLVGKQPLRYNRHVNKLYIDMDWQKVAVGNYIVAVCYQVVDPATYSDVWKDDWLQKYTTAKIQEQWGMNLTKFVGVSLPGGVQYNGERILDDARTIIKDLEEELITSYSPIVHDLIG